MGARRYVALAAVACACGGEDPPTYGHWTPTADGGAANGSRASDAAAWSDGQLFFWQSYAAQLYIYTRATNSWLAASAFEAPVTRLAPAFVWGNGKIYFWGATSCTQPGCDYGYIYDPTANRWSPMSMLGAPHTASNLGPIAAFWTGTELLVWDGTVGGLYDPTTDSWRSISTVGSPATTFGYGSAWTGTEMLIWGGIPSAGGRYDPAADRWTPITATSAPRPRVWPVAAWTGTEMLIWGGAGCDQICAEGAAYNPALDRWRAVPNHDGPGSALHAAAVWDGHEVLVWGGFQLEGADGARWDPATNSWSRMAKSNLGLRQFGFGFWTGSDALFWGGEVARGDGGFYTP